MTALKAFLVLFFNYYAFSYFGQTGNINIQTFEDEYFSAYLYKGDSLIQQKELSDIYLVGFDSLKSGIYKVIVITEDGKEFSYFPISVREGYSTIYDFNLPYIWDKELSDTINKYNKLETTFNFLTNLNYNETSQLINRNYQVGFSKDVFPNRKKHLSWGVLTGTSFSYTDFKNDTSYYNNIPNIKNERYFG